jgi:hypothetical protein
MGWNGMDECVWCVFGFVQMYMNEYEEASRTRRLPSEGELVGEDMAGCLLASLLSCFV